MTLGAHTWKNFGITLIYWMAALQTVPEAYYEAARVDGASSIRQLINITLRLLLPFAAVIIVLTANENLHAFALIQAMTGGGPYYTTQVMRSSSTRRPSRRRPRAGSPVWGYASAAGCFFGAATLVLALIQAAAVRGLSLRRSQMGA